ncbi:hypothetical protein NDU88_006875 [Pleurodeles waltl]|uniref:Uncharacterized protein n=1 Tax=Pleurodeles waltl TaxID=8319 RepID=A0AAV7MDH0_PLEWA|nr:hypothetical protein NDU88_006875 [Pleurodeles waltl]
MFAGIVLLEKKFVVAVNNSSAVECAQFGANHNTRGNIFLFECSRDGCLTARPYYAEHLALRNTVLRRPVAADISIQLISYDVLR